MTARAPRRIDSYWILVLPLLAILMALYLYPVIKVLAVSVTDPALGFGNYELLASNSGIQKMLWVTLRICVITSVITMGLGYVVSYVLVHVGDRHRMWMLLFILIPFWVSVLIRSFSWLILLRPDGIVNDLLIGVGLISEPLDLVRNETGVVIGMVHYMLPIAVLPLYANMRGIDQSFVAAARGLGAGPFEAFCRVFLPLSLAGVAGAGLLVFIFSLGFFVTPAILGGGKTIMIAEYVSIQILNIVKWGTGAMLSVVLLATVALLLAAMSRVINVREVFGAK
jgi:putative spermidine/putrescine transport system permease protein